MATITSPRAASPAPTPRITSPSVPSITSPLSTPTSSVRPSLELPRPEGNSATPSTASRPRTSNRAALRDYYNLKSRSGVPSVTTSGLARTALIASASSATSDTSVATSNTLTRNNGASETSPLLTSLDAPDFDPQSFITHLLSTSSLRDILKTESALVSEIRTLDGERKALVYDNYSKLIKAVGTIGEMQKGMVRRDSTDASYSTYSSKLGAQLGVGAKGGLDGVEALQEKLGGLEAEVRALRMSEEEVKEAEKYEEELRARKKVQGQRELVRWVLGSPERLEHVVDREEREMEWARVKVLLDRWEGVPGVDEVRKRGKEVMRRKAMETEKLQEEDET